MIRTLTIAAAMLALAACTPAAEAPMTDPAPGQSATPEAACAAKGGTMQPVGRAQTIQCVVAYSDAGKRCTDGDDCQGDCRVEDAPFPVAGAAAVGQCQANSQPFGCHARVEDGKAEPALCID